MKTDQYSILFSSLTGNTKKLADAIHETLPEEGCEYFGAIKNTSTIIRIIVYRILDR